MCNSLLQKLKLDFKNQTFDLKKVIKCLTLPALATTVVACSGSLSSSLGDASQIGTIGNHSVVLSSPSFSLNESSDAQVGTITVKGLKGGESDITLSFDSLTTLNSSVERRDYPLISTEPSPCVVSSSSPSCTIVINGNNSAESTYNYPVNYVITNGESGTLAKPMPVIVNNSLSPQRSGSLTMILNESQLNYESATTAAITLSNSAGITNLAINITKDNANISISPTKCNLSSTNISCTVNIVAGTESGVTYITASAIGYADMVESVTVNEPVTNKWVFVSQSSPNGAMLVNATGASWQANYPHANPIESADGICQHDAESAGWIGANSTAAANLTWKAMIVDGTNRNALPNHIDWVFESNMAYIDIISESMIGTTNESAIFDFPLTSGFGAGAPYLPIWATYNNYVVYWTGLSINWLSNTTQYICGDWKIGTTSGNPGTPTGVAGSVGKVTYQSIDDGGFTCQSRDYAGSMAMRLICVSQ